MYVVYTDTQTNWHKHRHALVLANIHTRTMLCAVTSSLFSLLLCTAMYSNVIYVWRGGGRERERGRGGRNSQCKRSKQSSAVCMEMVDCVCACSQFRSHIRSFVRSYAHSFVCWLTHSHVRSLVRSSIHSFFFIFVHSSFFLPSFLYLLPLYGCECVCLCLYVDCTI